MPHTEQIVVASVVALWLAVVLNLLLTLRLLRWHGGHAERQALALRREATPTLAPGARAPAFTARDIGGDPVTQAHIRGRTVVLAFVSPQCGSCTAHAPALVDLGRQFRDAGVGDLVLVSDSPLQRTRDWLEDCGLDPNTLGGVAWAAPLQHHDLFQVYNPRGLLPYFCAVDADGLVLREGPLGMEEWDRLLADLSERAA